MGGFNGCSSDEGQEGGEDQEREKVTDRPGTKMGVDAAQSWEQWALIHRDEWLS